MMVAARAAMKENVGNAMKVFAKED
jgi:hypothetical protein